ncbi:MAG: metalloprotease, partial [Bauldia sp.]
DSFQTLSSREVAALNSLRVRVVEARGGDSEASLVRQMRGVDRPRDLFRALNGLSAGARLAPGTTFKIVTDQ